MGINTNISAGLYMGCPIRNNPFIRPLVSCKISMNCNIFCLHLSITDGGTVSTGIIRPVDYKIPVRMIVRFEITFTCIPTAFADHLIGQYIRIGCRIISCISWSTYAQRKNTGHGQSGDHSFSLRRTWLIPPGNFRNSDLTILCPTPNNTITLIHQYASFITDLKIHFCHYRFTTNLSTKNFVLFNNRRGDHHISYPFRIRS